MSFAFEPFPFTHYEIHVNGLPSNFGACLSWKRNLELAILRYA